MFIDDLKYIQKRIHSFKGPTAVMYRGINKKLNRSLDNYYTDLSNMQKYIQKRKEDQMLKILAKREKQLKVNKGEDNHA